MKGEDVRQEMAAVAVGKVADPRVVSEGLPHRSVLEPRVAEQPWELLREAALANPWREPEGVPSPVAERTNLSRVSFHLLLLTHS